MGRPRLDDGTRRERTIGVRVSSAEFDQVHKKAVAAKLSVGKWTRLLWAGHVVRPVVVPGKFSVAERRELRRIGLNLNQAVRALAQAVKDRRGRNVPKLTRLARQIRKTALRISERVDPPANGTRT